MDKNIPHSKAIFGKPRSGKNTSLEDEVLWFAARLFPIILLLPHAHDWGPRIASLLIAAGHRMRLFIHRLSELRRVMQFNLLPVSNHVNPLRRMQENEEVQNAIRWQFGQKRQIDYERQALIDETLGLSLDLLMAQPVQYRLSDLLEATYPRSSLHRKLRNECLSDRVIMRLDSMLGGIVNERQTWGAAQRLVDQLLGSVEIQLRDGLDSPFETTIEDRAIHIFEGGNNTRVTSSFFNLVKIEVVAFMRNRWNRTGEAFPLLFVTDEAQGF